MYFSTKMKVLEKRQQRISDLRGKHKTLKEELEDTKSRLMMDPSKWTGECKYFTILLAWLHWFQLTTLKDPFLCNNNRVLVRFAVEVDQDLDQESQEYLEALEQATTELEYCVNLCKSHVMMVTCFDIRVSSDVQEGPREVEV